MGEVRSLPVTPKVLDNEDVIIVRFCIPGSEARVTCFLSSNVIYSYTCRKINYEKKKKREQNPSKGLGNNIGRKYFPTS